MRLLAINNLNSGLGDDPVYDYLRALASDGDEFVIRTVGGETDLRMLLHDADEFDLVVAAGGDGTVASVASFLANTAIPLLPFPSGTANLLTSNLAEPNDVHALSKITKSFKLMDFDIGMLDFPDGHRQGFMMMAGAGYDAEIMKDAKDAKKLFGQMAYFTSAVANASSQFAEFDLCIDGKSISTSGVGIMILNFSQIQFDLQIVHENKPRDGILDVVVLSAKDAYGLLPALFSVLLDFGGDYPARSDAIELYSGREISVKSYPPLECQYDGEVAGRTTPFTAKVLHKAARFVVSDECIRLYG